MAPHGKPDRPWVKVGVDLFIYKGLEYLIAVDYYSTFWEIDLQDNTRSCSVIRKLKPHFSRYGIPDKCISDNGQQLFSGDFKDFSKRMEIKACNPSPHYPPKQWESRISSQISEKKSHEEVKEGKSRSHVALFEHRNTPTQGLDTRPAQHPMSSRTRTLIPSMPSLL